MRQERGDPSRGEPLLRIAGNEELRLDLLKGCSNPARGWYSDRFGALDPAPQLVFRPFDRSARSFEIALDILPVAAKAPTSHASGMAVPA